MKGERRISSNDDTGRRTEGEGRRRNVTKKSTVPGVKLMAWQGAFRRRLAALKSGIPSKHAGAQR
ncbi:hypothetical protein [Burkholderia stabilis]|uniref:hypothetical protein n=1 Tax=Burkholderia stabilis TaxID=95485 RepID=UPI0012E9AC64|nr:hypothetical protein [Burkholderia stabilis]HDR9496200.1 hypothetical protein [Burkholderia stabilis]HDR9527761.1 hypothetical protein [Burkholderia stabilis]HDR9542772.1 hypothetical protein [Burkholderia stabilis]HDR9573042.1 hypothetical protein [Burkholderia stabilis]HDR9581239.1 hypothetical protein [Burkholderia stabilis]